MRCDPCDKNIEQDQSSRVGEAKSEMSVKRRLLWHCGPRSRTLSPPVELRLVVDNRMVCAVQERDTQDYRSASPTRSSLTIAASSPRTFTGITLSPSTPSSSSPHNRHQEADPKFLGLSLLEHEYFYVSVFRERLTQLEVVTQKPAVPCQRSSPAVTFVWAIRLRSTAKPTPKAARSIRPNA